VAVGLGVDDAGSGVLVLNSVGFGVAEAGRGVAGGSGVEFDAGGGGGGLSPGPGAGAEVLEAVAPSEIAVVATGVRVG